MSTTHTPGTPGTRPFRNRRPLGTLTAALAVGAALQGGCGEMKMEDNSNKTAFEQAIAALGGSEALLALSEQEVTASGNRFEPGQAEKPDDPPRELAPYTYKSTYDLSGDRVHVNWTKRSTLFGTSLPFAEVVNGELGFFSKQHNIFAAPTPSAMLSSRVAAVRKHERLFHPHLLLRSALQNKTPVTDLAEVTLTIGKDKDKMDQPHRVISLPDDYQPVKLYISKKTGLVSKVETIEDDPVYGDITLEAAFTDYVLVAGLRLPYQMTLTLVAGNKRIALQTEKRSIVGIGQKLDATLFTVPQLPAAPTKDDADAARGARLAELIERYAHLGVTFDANYAKSVMSQRIGTVGLPVYHITGGTGHTLAIELANEIVVVEAYADEERSVAVINEIKAKISGKNITYLINTHHHHDHAGGVRAYLALGATVVTADSNVKFFEAMIDAPHTVNPDSLQKTPRPDAKSQIKAVPITADPNTALPFTITDGTRRVQVYPLKTSHDPGMLMVYVEDAMVACVADIYSPGFFDDPMNPLRPLFVPGAKELYTGVTARGIPMSALIAGVHGFETDTVAELKINAGQ